VSVPRAPRQLRDRIQSRVAYPPESIRREEEGEVLLRVLVGEGGAPREIRLHRSSGIRRLDDAARRGVAGAVPLPSSPGWYEVPVRFSLR
jgi:protein TonB